MRGHCGASHSSGVLTLHCERIQMPFRNTSSTMFIAFFFSLPKLKAICQTLFFFVYFTRSALNKCMIYALGWNLEIALRPLESSFLQTKEAFKPFCLIASRYRMIQERNPYSLLLLLWWESAQHSTGGSQLFGFFILFWCFYPIFHLSLHLILRYISSSWK